MKTLFLLIALYTLSSKQAVPSGDVPDGATCEFAQSGTQTGQMTAGNYVRLTLNGYEGMTLNSVSLQMHSNKDSGAGSLKMTVGGTTVWTIDDATFNAPSWAGKYSKDWMSISHPLGGVVVPKDVPITLYISASENSLYLQSVELNYSAPAPKSYTVSFATHIPLQVSSVTEAQSGAGVRLPDVPLEDPEWQFLGWMEWPLAGAEEMPAVMYAGMQYYPYADCVIHAVYVQRVEAQPWLPADDLTSGDYLIALYEPNSGWMFYARGEVENGLLQTVSLVRQADKGWVSLPNSACAADAIYSLTLTNDTLSIVHKQTGTPVRLGSGGNFTQNSFNSKNWIISPMETDKDPMPHFSISAVTGAKTYYVSFWPRDDGAFFFRPTDSAGQQHDILLFAVADCDVVMPYYTSFPFGGDVLQTATDVMPTMQTNIGPYILTIRNGKKYLQINE